MVHTFNEGEELPNGKSSGSHGKLARRTDADVDCPLVAQRIDSPTLSRKKCAACTRNA
jgi:hypothetical protein